MTNNDMSVAEFITDLELASQMYGIEVVDEAQKQVKIHVAGIESTPYAGGIYEIFFDFPANYPDGPPTVTFKTPIWNSAVGPKSQNVLFHGSETWNIINAIAYVEGLILKTDVDEFSTYYRVARFWACQFAGAPKSPEEIQLKSVVDQLVDMGFPMRAAIVALSNSEWNVEHASEELLREESGAKAGTNGEEADPISPAEH
ncbi:unnamed protein product [Caenorhabditis nigoni]